MFPIPLYVQTFKLNYLIFFKWISFFKTFKIKTCKPVTKTFYYDIHVPVYSQFNRADQQEW